MIEPVARMIVKKLGLLMLCIGTKSNAGFVQAACTSALGAFFGQQILPSPR